MRTLADILSTATREQLAKVRRATGLSEGQLEYRSADLSAPWIKQAVADALRRPVDEVFGQSGRQS